jgi:hypothetical protein
MRKMHVPLNDTAIARETDKAFGCDFGQGADRYGKIPLMWFPKSQVERVDDELIVPEWLARKNNMLEWVKYGCYWGD